MNISSLLTSLWKLLERRRKIQFICLIVMMIFSAFAEVLSIGAVLPFLGVISSPETIFEMDITKPFINLLSIESPDQLLITFSLVFAGAVIFAAIFRTILLWLTMKISYSTGSELSIKAFKTIIDQPYIEHVNRNSSELISIMGPKLNNAVAVINNVLIFFSSFFIMIGILILLVLVQPIASIIMFASFALIYMITTFYFRVKLLASSQNISVLGPLLVKTLQESLGGIRNLIIDDSKKEFIHIYSEADNNFRSAQGNINFISSSPRPIMEALGILLIICLAYFLSLRSGGIESAIPILGFIALGAQRLLPSLQQTYAAWSYIKGEQKSLEDILNILYTKIDSTKVLHSNLEFKETIHLKNICYSFGEDLPWILEDFDLKIEKGSWIGVIGETGAGKSTLLDIIMGLLEPSKGGLYIDDKLLSSSDIKSWQSKIAHVPQVIFLADTSVYENIAFGVNANEIDCDLVIRSAKIAQINETIESLPTGYETIVGERGIKLSGGQRQRIGIARALYKQAEVIVLDEATNALDSSKENLVMKALKGLNKNITVIMVAHRLSTLDNCTQVIDFSADKEISDS
jgi:ATP-binding cassette, subfamily B, bacterial PglK